VWFPHPVVSTNCRLHKFPLLQLSEPRRPAFIAMDISIVNKMTPMFKWSDVVFRWRVKHLLCRHWTAHWHGIALQSIRIQWRVEFDCSFKPLAFLCKTLAVLCWVTGNCSLCLSLGHCCPVDTEVCWGGKGLHFFPWCSYLLVVSTLHSYWCYCLNWLDVLSNGRITGP